MLPFVHAQALSTPPTHLRQRSTRRSAASTAAPTQSNAYRLASAASVAAWSACAVTALSRHPTLALPAAHARLSILQALTPLPLLAASFEAAPEDRTVQLWRRVDDVSPQATYLALLPGPSSYRHLGMT